MRSQKEILDKIEELEKTDFDFTGIMQQDLKKRLTWSNVQPYLKPEHRSSVCPPEWKVSSIIEKEEILKEMRDYIDFAYEKAYDQRGLSAIRSIMHYMCWIWLLGKEYDGFLSKIMNAFLNNFEPYGIPILRMIADEFGWDWKKLEHGLTEKE